MVNYYIYARDCSGSTGGEKHYHSNGLKTLDQFKNDVAKIQEEILTAGEPPTKTEIVYLNWGSQCWQLNEDEVRDAYLKLKCENTGTNPEVIIQCLQHNLNKNEDKIKLLYIITDGMICQSSATACSELNESMNYETVVFHAFNENFKAIDISVAASFFKRRCMIYRNYELYDSTDISKEFDYHEVNVDNFLTEKEQLKSYIRLKFVNKFKQDAVSLREIDNLKKLRFRLFQELSVKESNDKKPEINLETLDRKIFLDGFIRTDWYKTLSASIYDLKVDIEKSISTLINYIISDVKSYSFDALKFDVQFDKSVEKEEIINVEFTAEQEIVFPDVILDDDKGIPVIILSELNLLNKIIFNETNDSSQLSPASFSKFKSTMECPLFLMNDQDISESIGYFYTLNVYKQLLANNTKTDPRTRKPFHGGLVLTDTDQFDKYNDYILSATYFDSKKIHYNIGLFYFVLWKNCEKKEWMDRNVVELLKKYTFRRIRETKCKIGLSSLPMDPQVKTSLLTALWYCVELSSCIFKNHPKFYHQERLRKFCSIVHYMIEILQYFNYDLDLETIEKRRELINYVMILKKIQIYRDKVYYILEKILKTKHGFLVSEIEKPYNLYKLNYLKLNHKEMLPDDIVLEKVHLNDYIFLLYIIGDVDVTKLNESTFDICEKTFRPYFVIDRNKSFYTELVNITRKVVIKNDDDKDTIEVTYEAINSLKFYRILSLYKLLIDCVDVLDKYPTLTEYLEFISRKKKFNGYLVTVFPSNFYSYVINVFERYQKIVAKVEIKEFKQVCDNYVNRTERIKAEEKVKFSDNEIIEFISSEESKVNLKKKVKNFLT